MKIAIIGFGSRGRIYATNLKKYTSGNEVVAVVDTNADRRIEAEEKYGVKKEYIFDDADKFFALGKIADVLVVACSDETHYDVAMKGLEIGYDLLLEKPVSNDLNECRKIRDKAIEKQAKVVVCHVLRYTPFYNKLKQIISSGEIGEIVTFSQTENVGYSHQAHSFVRGNWRNSDISSPMILAKCCHDMDIIRWLIGKPCKAVSSFGSLTYFKEVNAPKNSAEKCVDCTVDCIYNAVDFYKHNSEFWGFISDGKMPQEEFLKTSPYGRCVYKCDNNVVDHQVVNLLFDDSVTAQLTMTAFSDRIHRELHIHGTKADMVADMEENFIEVRPFGGKPYKVEVVIDNDSGHCGGDKGIIVDAMKYFSDGVMSDRITEIGVSVESHEMAFAAEKSRVMGGEVIKL